MESIYSGLKLQAGFGRKMYTDYEIMCKVCHSRDCLGFSDLMLVWRPTFLRLSFDIRLFDGVILTSKLSVMSLSVNLPA